MAKIGLITFHSAHNYGAMFQAYATQKVIYSLGHECYIIDLYNKRLKEVVSIFTKRKGLKYRLKNAFNLMNYKNAKLKYNRFMKYIEDNMIVTQKRYFSGEEIIEEELGYDIYLSGSDQIWNLSLSDYDYAYYLSFAKDKKRVSYATSFGSATFKDKAVKEKVASLLSKYDYISLRESKGAQIVKDLIGKNCDVVVDPVILLQPDDWDAQTVPVNIKDDYILYYNMKPETDTKKIAKVLSKRLNLPVVNTKIMNQGEIFTGFINKINTGPVEFLSLLKNAKLIVTSSFHGTVLSIMFKKPFVTVNGLSDIRMSNLLTTCKLTDRAITFDNVNNFINPCQMDFTQAHKILKKERERSIKLLKKSLQNI